MKFLMSLLLTIFCSAQVWALDRSANIQGRLSSSLGNILPLSDFLVTVNRLDQLEGGQAEAISGNAKPLPGLALSVDSKGNVVRQDYASHEYNGPVSISILIDRNVKKETYELIRKEISDLSGGLRDLDEIRIDRGVLRQAPIPNPNQSSITINQPKSDESAKSWSDNLKLMAIFVVLGGLFLWLSSRRPEKPANTGNPNIINGADPRANPENPEKNGSSEKIAFNDIPPEIVSLFLLKSIKDRQIDKFQTWIKTSNPSEQRSILMTLPSWAAVGFEKMIQQSIEAEAKKKSSGEDASNSNSVSHEKIVCLYREMSVLERNLRETVDYQKAFLMWFPPHFVREVSQSQKNRLSESSKRLLWSLRPDLGEFVRMDINLGDEVQKINTPIEISSCYEELSGWRSSAFADNSSSRDIIQVWTDIVNQLTEFGSIKSQLAQAKVQLTADQYAQLERRTVGIQSPLTWDDEMRRRWLLEVSPEDYVYWTSLAGTSPPWNLDTELRPLRRSMFKTATDSELYKSWDESAKKSAALRLLSQFRKIQLGMENVAIEAA